MASTRIPGRRITRFADTPDYPDGHAAFWFAGENVIRFAPPKNAPPPPSPLWCGKFHPVGAPSTAEPPKATKLFRLPAETRALLFHFAALNYDNPAGTEYEYYLEGADRDWSSWAPRRAANYSGLGPGILPLPRTGSPLTTAVWATKRTSPSPPPPWYETVWAWAATNRFLLISWLVWSLVINYERRQRPAAQTEALEAQARELEATVSARTQEIRAQATEISAQKESIELLSDIGQGDHRLARSEYHSLQARTSG